MHYRQVGMRFVIVNTNNNEYLDTENTTRDTLKLKKLTDIDMEKEGFRTYDDALKAAKLGALNPAFSKDKFEITRFERSGWSKTGTSEIR